MKRQVKVGMISFAHGHAFSYLEGLSIIPEAIIAGIAHSERTEVEDVLKRTGATYYADYHDLLLTDIDAVIICSENAYHAKLTIDAAKAGKHVMCEKPLGLSVLEMESMISVCRDEGVQLMTAFPCRFLSAVVRAREAVMKGDIGEIIAIKGTNRGSMPGSWFVDPSLSGGGALLDHTVHVMDLMHWFLPGSRVTEVYAYANRIYHEEISVEDAGMIHVKFDNGVMGVIDTSWSRSKSFPTWGDVTMEIVGTAGTISLDCLAQTNEWFIDKEGKGQYHFWGDSMDHLLVKSFIEAIAADLPVPINGIDGLRSTEIALAGYRSVKSGQPVQL
ncbi:Gfo/Idh/MocA family protein [Paenibacillus macerans]|uniref:Gfo/Idh/MocA family protein n=1 Tax=Paenibacillus macerans TaxID=44252 RepID=UPI003D31DF80